MTPSFVLLITQACLLLDGIQLDLFQPGICQLCLGCIKSEVYGLGAAELCLELMD